LKTYLLLAFTLLFALASCASQPPFGSADQEQPATAVAQKTLILLPTSTFTAQPPATATPTRAPATATRTPAQPPATATPTRMPATPRPSATPTRAPQSGSIVVDHNSVALFDRIPEQYLTAARNLPMMYMDQSVGMNISQGLDCLAASSWGEAPVHCRRDYDPTSSTPWTVRAYTAADLQAGTVPPLIQFPADSNRYNRSNWTFVSQSGSWQEYLAAFLTTQAPAHINQKDVLSFQFTYLHVAAGSDIVDPNEGFFVDQPHSGFYPNRERWDISDLRDYQAQHPDKVFIYWTTSLARDIGSAESITFNEQMRQYAIANQFPLFDVADILSHDPEGNPCYDNRDGVEYCGPNGCENYPDDGQNVLAICQNYTTETNGGHLGSVSGGKIQLAKAFWVLMAQIAGWRP